MYYCSMKGQEQGKAVHKQSTNQSSTSERRGSDLKLEGSRLVGLGTPNTLLTASCAVFARLRVASSV